MISAKESANRSNLERFLDCATPIVQSQFLPKSEIGNLNGDREKVEYFTLGDLWGSFEEWSAYGLGVPIKVEETGEALVQYYVPYLSAIQIFTGNSPFNGLREETDSSSDTRDLLSDWLSDESESEKLSRSWDGSSSEESNDWHFNDRFGYPYFQHFERSSPYSRVPLMDKISGLAERYPGLMSLKSVDLSPASWMAVAWYPIYHIPMGRTIKDLSTCFLTYHTLSSCFQDTELDSDMTTIKKKSREHVIPLAPFGLATYRMQGGVWVSDQSGTDRERLALLTSVADSWLKQLRVQHHDFTTSRELGLANQSNVVFT